MYDTALIALITGAITAGTALAVGWLTSRATIRAAQIQVERAAEIDGRERKREQRKKAYIDLMSYATEIRIKGGVLVGRITDGDSNAINELRVVRDEAQVELARLRHLAHLEGPESIETALEELRDAFDTLSAVVMQSLRDGTVSQLEVAARTQIEAADAASRRFRHAAMKALE